MSGCFGTSAEDQYFERQLHSHLAQLSYSEQREISEEQAMEEITDTKSEDYFLSYENVAQALEDLTYTRDPERMAFITALAKKLDAEDLDTAKFVKAEIKKYWLAKVTDKKLEAMED